MVLSFSVTKMNKTVLDVKESLKESLVQNTDIIVKNGNVLNGQFS